MIIIEFNKNILNGGFGDRIVGLISLKTIADFIGTEFYIKWDKENINSVISFNKYNFYNKIINKFNKFNKFDLMTPNLELIKKWEKTNYLINNNVIININYDIFHIFCKNKDEYYNYLINNFEKLYNDIFILNDKIINEIHNIVNNKDIIGVQIRAGDHWINVGEYVENHIKDINIIIDILKNIKNINQNKYIYLSSDIDLKKIGEEIFKEYFLYCDIKPTHLDKNPDDNCINKIIIDNYILSQCCESIYISEYSNFGKIAALSGNHKKIYNTKLEEIDKKYIIGKIYKAL